jgi:hypothetical protein
MTGESTGKAGATTELPLGDLDAEAVEQIDVHLDRALRAEEADRKDFHVRHAYQLLEVYRSS